MSDGKTTMDTTTSQPGGGAWIPVLRSIVFAAGFLFAVAGAVMALNHRQARTADPLNSPVLLELLERARETPADSNRVAQARSMDLLARRAFFTGQSMARRGAGLLLAGAALLLLAAKGLGWIQPKAPLPSAAPDPAAVDRTRQAARVAIGAFGGFFAAGLLLVGLPASEDAPPGAAPSAGDEGVADTDPVPGPAAADAVADDGEMLANWPAFRGFRGLGGAVASAPVEWDGPSGKGILWKTPVPRPGFSSPIIWGDRVFLTGADGDEREVYCFDANDGSLLWRHSAAGIPGSPSKPPKAMEDTGLAAPTMATDGRRVYAMFATGDLVACDFDGARLWAKNLGLPDNPYGHASSLLTHGGHVIVQFDQSQGGRLYVLRGATGDEVWVADRDVQSGWSSPIVFESAGRPLIGVLSAPMLAAYDPADGREVWRVSDLEAEIGTSPAVAGGRIFAGNEYTRFVAANADTGEELWEWEDELPDIASPLAADDWVLLASSAGVVTCLDAASGELVWQHEYDDAFHSTPMAAAGRVYLTDSKGITHVIAAGRIHEPVATNDLGEACSATPAFARGRMFLRGTTHLVCIGAGDAAP